MADGSDLPAFDWRNPDYVPVFQARMRRLAWIRAQDAATVAATPDKAARAAIAAQRLRNLKTWYRDHPADFINDWGMTFDPRNGPNGLPSVLPFLLFPKQRAFIEWADGLRRGQAKGLADKSRDMGFSWLLVAWAATLCLFGEQMTFGFGSRDEDSVDRIGDPDSLFWKLRFFVENVPPEFKGDWNVKRNTSHMRVSFPTTNSVITGDAGDNIGRGGRSQVYVVDEAAALKNPTAVEASLSQTTNCRLDVSTPRGMANPFAQKRHSGKFPTFTMHWRDDPRKNNPVPTFPVLDINGEPTGKLETWYEKQVRELDPVTLAQEVDLSYTASATGVLIPSAWVQAAVNAHVKLGLAITGARRGALDVADEGIDLNAFAVRHGILVESVVAWSGKGDDIFGTVQRAFMLADDAGADAFDYDADGLGAGVRGDARVINEGRTDKLKVEPFRGSGAVFKPDDPIPTANPKGAPKRDSKERLNKDFFANAKAQAWWTLRVKFQRTFRALAAYDAWRAAQPFPDGAPAGLDAYEGVAPFVLDYDPDDLISLNGDMAELAKLTLELSQPTFSLNNAGKVVIDKAPDGTRSPNHADAVMIANAPRKVGSWLTRVY